MENYSQLPLLYALTEPIALGAKGGDIPFQYPEANLRRVPIQPFEQRAARSRVQPAAIGRKLSHIVLLLKKKETRPLSCN
jgi:hypothetical protein